jgi:hypothetical protein
MFLGEFKDGTRIGKEVFKQENGLLYEGEWVGDCWSGYGSLTLPSGEKFEGDFVDNYCTGHAIYTSADGEKYEG